MEKNEQTKSDKKTLLIVLLLLIAIVAVILATYVWAKYAEKFNGEATASVAKWNVTGETGGTFSKTFTEVVDGKIAPGTSGEFTANIDVDGTEVGVNYTVTLVGVETLEGSDEQFTINGETVTGHAIPQNLVIKADASQGKTVIFQNGDVNGGLIAEGYFPAGSTGESAKAAHTFTWDWPYETPAPEGTPDEAVPAIIEANNNQDTADGKVAGSFKITYRIDAYQVQPGTAQGGSSEENPEQNPEDESGV